MEQIKTFYGFDGFGMETVEKEVNEWLRKNPNITVISRHCNSLNIPMVEDQRVHGIGSIIVLFYKK